MVSILLISLLFLSMFLFSKSLPSNSSVPTTYFFDPKPFDGEKDLPVHLNLSWSFSIPPNISSYEIQVSLGSSPTSLSFLTQNLTLAYPLSNNSYKSWFPVTLEPGTTYYWMVSLKDQDSSLRYSSPIWKFSTHSPPFPLELNLEQHSLMSFSGATGIAGNSTGLWVAQSNDSLSYFETSKTEFIALDYQGIVNPNLTDYLGAELSTIDEWASITDLGWNSTGLLLIYHETMNSSSFLFYRSVSSKNFSMTPVPSHVQSVGFLPFLGLLFGDSKGRLMVQTPQSYVTLYDFGENASLGGLGVLSNGDVLLSVNGQLIQLELRIDPILGRFKYVPIVRWNGIFVNDTSPSIFVEDIHSTGEYVYILFSSYINANSTMENVIAKFPEKLFLQPEGELTRVVVRHKTVYSHTTRTIFRTSLIIATYYSGTGSSASGNATTQGPNLPIASLSFWDSVIYGIMAVVTLGLLSTARKRRVN